MVGRVQVVETLAGPVAGAGTEAGRQGTVEPAAAAATAVPAPDTRALLLALKRRRLAQRHGVRHHRQLLVNRRLVLWRHILLFVGAFHFHQNLR